LSSSDPRVLIGLGNTTEVAWIEVDSPGNGGQKRRIERRGLDRYIDVR
jgi:hypothetical protein